jgi:tRNA (adenine58-N1)-methyltransferase non-catalytic subunit
VHDQFHPLQILETVFFTL